MPGPWVITTILVACAGALAATTASTMAAPARALLNLSIFLPPWLLPVCRRGGTARHACTLSSRSNFCASTGWTFLRSASSRDMPPSNSRRNLDVVDGIGDLLRGVQGASAP